MIDEQLGCRWLRNFLNLEIKKTQKSTQNHLEEF